MNRAVRALVGVGAALAVGGACGALAAGSGSSRSADSRPELAVFRARGNARYDLARADARGRHLTVLDGDTIHSRVVPQLFTSISWSPRGGQLAFAATRGDAAGSLDKPNDVYTIRADGSRLRRVTRVGNAADPIWSPDGRTIVFTRIDFRRQRPLRESLWSVSPDGSDLTELIRAGAWRAFTANSFLPNGRQLAVTRSVIDPRTGHASSEIDETGADGSNRRLLVADASDAAFSPDGARLAFVSGRDRSGRLCYGDRCFHAGELYVANANGSQPERLTRTHALNESHPTWLGDSSRLAYQRGEAFQNAEAMSVFEINPDGTCSRPLLHGRSPGPWYAGPAWRPGGAAGALAC